MVATAALVKVVGGAGAGCGGDLTLRVAAAPEIASAVRDVAGRWRADPPRVDGYCVHVAVTAAEPAAVAAAVARRSGGALDIGDPATGDGDGEGVTSAAVPDVWIPDATSWLDRVRTVDRDAFSGPAPSIATSPVVVAMPEPLARSLGWPARPVDWPRILDLARGADPRRAALVEPRRSASGVSGLLAFAAAARAAAAAAHHDPDAAVLDLYASLAATRTGSVAALLDEFRQAPDRAMGVAPLPEWAVLGYDQRQPPVPLAAVYPEPMAPQLDYPLVTLAREPRSRASGEALPQRTVRAATALRAALTSEANRAVFAAHGFRAPDGTFGPGFPSGWGVTGEPAPATPPVAPEQLSQALTAWVRVSLPVRALTVVDVSPSMGTAPSRHASWLAATRDALSHSVQALGDSCDVGLWVFGAALSPSRGAATRHHREIAPVGPLATGRQRLVDALTTVVPQPGGGSALRATVLAAYQAAVTGYATGKSNVVVVITDSRDDNRAGPSLPELLTELEKLSDPTRPVRVVPIGLGPGVDVAELAAIARATGGTAVHLPHPTGLTDALLRALTVAT